jgi:soluble lytic murein transglycosylase-like protein/TolA-binding protein
MIINKKRRYSISLTKMIFFILPAVIIPFILVITGCSIFEGDFFGLEFGDSREEDEEIPFEELEENIEAAPEDIEEEQSESVDIPDTSQNIQEEIPVDKDLEEMRYNFSEAIKHFDEEAYIVSEYYLLKIKDNYLILQDHIFYYLAKSLLMQKKYDQSEEYYNKVLQNFPDSIWLEKSVLETADLYYLREDYIGAEEKYNDFLNLYGQSDYSSYCLFQLAVCMEKNGRPADAFAYYKKIWLEYPASEFAGRAYLEIERLEEESVIASFSPSMEDLYGRAESLFYSYRYQEASDELLDLINGYPRNSFTAEAYANACFRLGMSYYNMADYDQALDWLLLCYKEGSGSSIAHASLFFTGRTYTNLDDNSRAISYYNKLLSEYPSSSYSDDALYRMGRIYSIEDNAGKAIESFERVFKDYPSGDMTDEAMWELGWIQYKSGDWAGAKASFSNMASLFSSGTLKEKAMYWQAKCHIKLEEEEKAIGLCRQIAGFRNYSYYTFAALELADSAGTSIDLESINIGLSPDNPEAEEILPGIFEDLNRDIANTDGWVDHITKALELIRLDYHSSAAIEIGSGEEILENDPERALEIATLYYNAQDYFNCLSLIFNNFSNIRNELSEDHLAYAYYLYYPYGYKDIIDKYSEQYGIDPLFALAVIRQESNFKADAGSYAGAQGLMQIMPATGNNIANQIGLSGFEEEMLHDPEINIEMGVYYLDQQLDNFDRDLVYCLGAYNGGPGSMTSWISRFGDKDEDEFIEHITYLETKDYIKKVMGNYYFYRMLFP